MTNDRITGPCPECERLRAENARLKLALPTQKEWESINALVEGVKNLIAENARLREALEQIVNGIATHTSPAECRYIARAALEVEK